MVHRKARIAAGLIGSIAVLVGTAGIGAAQSPAASAPAASGGSPVCDAVPVGIVTRCENFYTDYWPTINTALDGLYQEALATNGGQIVIWDWYELSPDVINAFTTRFPGLKIKTQGFQDGLAAAIITAQQTGTENSDYLSGSLTSATQLYDAGLFDKVDWTSYGIPAEYFTVGPSELLPDSLNSWLINSNSSKEATVPDTYEAYLDAAWKDKLAMASWNGQFFTGYGMVNGTDKMQQLIKDLKASNLTLTDDPGSLLSTGDKPVVFAGQLFNPNPDLALTPMKDAGVWIPVRRRQRGSQEQARRDAVLDLERLRPRLDHRAPDDRGAEYLGRALPRPAQLDARQGHGAHQAERGCDVRRRCDRPVGDHREPRPVELAHQRRQQRHVPVGHPKLELRAPTSVAGALPYPEVRSCVV